MVISNLFHCALLEDYMYFKEKEKWKLCRHPERKDETAGE